MFTSCDSSDDSVIEARALTDSEKVLYKQAIQGNYSGYLVYLQPDDINGTQVEKSLPASWNVNTETMQLTVSNFPLKAIADVTRHLDLKALLEQADPVNMTAKVELVDPEYTQYIEQGLYSYFMTPAKMEFTVDGKNVTINFWVAMNYNGTRYESVATVYDKAFTMPVLIRDVQVNYNNYNIDELMYLTTSYTPLTKESDQ
jgi:hypothetical protein